MVTLTRADDVYEALKSLGFTGSMQDVQFDYLKNVYLSVLGTSADRQRLTAIAPPTRELLEVRKVMTNLMKVTKPTLPNGALSQTFDRSCQIGALPTAVATSGRLRLVYMPVLPGMVINQLSFYTGVAAVGTTNLWFALYDLALNYLSATNDDGATGFAANVEKKLALASPYTVPDGVYGVYAGFVWVGATTPPQLAGSGNQSAPVLLDKAIGGSSTGGLTNPGSAPSVAAALDAVTFGAGIPYCAAW